MARRPNAYSQLIKEGKKKTAQDETVTPASDTTVTMHSGRTVKNRITVKNNNTVKITIYPSQEQLGKLYDFMEAYRKKTGVKINQQNLIRRIIDVADINTVLP
jgi:hypothetical protein